MVHYTIFMVMVLFYYDCTHKCFKSISAILFYYSIETVLTWSHNLPIYMTILTANCQIAMKLFILSAIDYMSKMTNRHQKNNVKVTAHQNAAYGEVPSSVTPQNYKTLSI